MAFQFPFHTIIVYNKIFSRRQLGFNLAEWSKKLYEQNKTKKNKNFFSDHIYNITYWLVVDEL